MSLLLFIIALFSVLTLGIPFALPGSQGWYWVLFSANVQTFLWSFLATSLIGYDHLKAKAISGGFCAASFVDLLFFFGWDCGRLSQLGRALQLGLIVAWFWWLFYRHYNQASDAVRRGFIYKVMRRPADMQDFLLSYINDPAGGISAICDGVWYHYRRGRFVISSAAPVLRQADRYLIKEIVPRNEQILEELKGLEGEKWSLFSNCLTRIEPPLNRSRKWQKTQRKRGQRLK